jgi:hypothetical protein
MRVSPLKLPEVSACLHKRFEEEITPTIHPTGIVQPPKLLTLLLIVSKDNPYSALRFGVDSAESDPDKLNDFSDIDIRQGRFGRPSDHFSIRHK